MALVFICALSFITCVDLLAEGVSYLEGMSARSNLAVLVLAALLYGFARSSRFDPDLVLNLSRAFEVSFCLILSVEIPWSAREQALQLGMAERHGDLLPYISWVTPVIIMFPLIIPSPPRLTLLVSIVSAATRPLGLFIFAASTGLVYEPRNYVHSIAAWRTGS